MTIEPCRCRFSQPRLASIDWYGVEKCVVECMSCGRRGSIEVMDWVAIESWNRDAKPAPATASDE
jgi:hypothetical protein